MLTQRKMLVKMLEMQNKLNIGTAGKYWVGGHTTEGRDINWNMCIFMECAEAINSLNWKHWKDINGKNNLKNVEMELIDIWHFELSKALVSRGELEDQISLESLADVLLCGTMNDADYIIPTGVEANIPVLINNLEDLAKDALNNEEITLETGFILKNVAVELNMSFGDIYTLYMVKNLLNIFRQDNGYKEGTYIKEYSKDGVMVEDNEMLTNFVEITGSVEDGFEEFKEFYKTQTDSTNA